MTRSLVLFVVGVIWATLISAQGVTNVKCNVTTVDQWAFNVENQSPCQVAANLGAVCATTGSYTIDALTPAFEHYYTPSPLATPCECSSIVYSLAAACGLCQGGSFTTWLNWQTNCSAISPGTFPFSIPQDTFIPNWAYQDVQATNSFSPANAESVGDEPESSPPAPSPTVRSSSPASSPKPSQTASSEPAISSTPAAPSSSHKSDAGAIAGGVVGGVAVIAILGALLFFLARSNRKKRAVQNGSDTQGLARNPEKYDATTPGYTPAPFSPTNDGEQSYMSKPYDPNDPSTFPTSAGSPNSSATFNNQSPFPHNGAANSQHGSYAQDRTSMIGGTPAPHYPGQYSGVAEV